MAKMAIYGKNPLKIFSRTISQVTLKLGRQQKGHEPKKSYINYDPGLTLTYFMANLVPKKFEWEKGKTVHLSKTIVVY